MKLHLIEKAFFLKKITIFESLDLDLLLTIADRLEINHQRAGGKIFHIGQEAKWMYFIVEGAVELKNKAGNSCAILKQEDFFGDEALLARRTQSYEAHAKKVTTLLTLSYSHLISIINECPEVAIALLKIYSECTECRKR